MSQQLSDDDYIVFVRDPQTGELKVQPRAPEKFYLLDLKVSKGDMLSWWRPNSSGYCWDLGSAGLYDEAEATDTELRSTHAGVRKVVKIPQAKAESLTSRVVEECHFDKLGIGRDEWRKARRR